MPRHRPSSAEWVKAAGCVAYLIWFLATYWPRKRKELALLRAFELDMKSRTFGGEPYSMTTTAYMAGKLRGSGLTRYYGRGRPHNVSRGGR